jgi:hypothetical protein
MSKTLFFKWQLQFLTLGINVKFHFKTTFIDIVYALFQPFCRNFYFLFVLFECLFKNRITVGCKKSSTSNFLQFNSSFLLSILKLPRQAKCQNFSFLTSDIMTFLVSDITCLKKHAIKSQKGLIYMC